MSQAEKAAAHAEVDNDEKGYPTDLKKLRPQVQARVKHVIDVVGMKVDDIFQAVADEGSTRPTRDTPKG
jgi:hypothetical protein